MKRNIVIAEEGNSFIEDTTIEMVERKGLGHPDSLCDGIAEQISADYCNYCKKHIKLILHHNFDKVQLVAGKASPRFGGGEIEEPIKIQIAGRGTKEYKGIIIPVDELAEDSARMYLRNTLRHYNPTHFDVNSYAGAGSVDLIELYERYGKGEIPYANDTSFGISHYPLSDLENIVLRTENIINKELHKKYKQIGEDVKVMGFRDENKIEITVAIAMIGSEFSSNERIGFAEYKELKDSLEKEILGYLQKHSEREISVKINTADNYAARSVYITVTGTSGENGDDGAVGRGNRVNSLITPYRRMSLEASCGKNPISHTGKIYNVVSLLAAKEIINKINGIKEVTVSILSRIGSRIDQPQVASIIVYLEKGTKLNKVKPQIANIIDNYLENIMRLSDMIIQGGVVLF